MDKHLVEKYIGKAQDVLQKAFPEGKAEKMMRSKMSAFGAVVRMNGPLPAIAYYEDNEPKIVSLLAGMYDTTEDKLFRTVREALKKNRTSAVETLLAYSVSLKMALNLFTLTESAADKK